MAGKRVLMVEGPDDEHVVKHICGERRLGHIETIRPYGGKDSLLEGIGVRLKESDITVLGIILDADADLQPRWQALSTRLSALGMVACRLRQRPKERSSNLLRTRYCLGSESG